MTAETPRAIFIGNLPLEFEDKCGVLTDLNGYPPAASIESFYGRVIGLAAEQNGYDEPPGIMMPDNVRFRRFMDGIGMVFNSIGIAPPRAYWMPDTAPVGGFSTEATLLSALEDEGFTKQFDRGVRHTVYPNRNAGALPAFLDAARAKGIDLVSGVPYYDIEHRRNPLNRSGWGRDPENPSAPAFPDRHDIPYPPSCLADSFKDLEVAYSHVTKRNGRPQVFIKRAHSSSGEIYGASSLEELQATYQRIAQEGRLSVNGKNEPVEIQGAIDIVADLSFQYDEGELITPGGLTIQLFDSKHPDTWIGNMWNVPIPNVPREDQTRLRQEIEDIGYKVKRGLIQELGQGNVGRGGVDIAIVWERGRLTAKVLEHNGGRLTGAHPATAVARTLGITNQPFLFTKVSGTPVAGVADVHKHLKNQGMHYTPDAKEGVFPLLWLERTADSPGSGCGYLFMTAPTQEKLERMMADSESVLQQAGLVTV